MANVLYQGVAAARYPLLNQPGIPVTEEPRRRIVTPAAPPQQQVGETRSGGMRRRHSAPVLATRPLVHDTSLAIPAQRLQAQAANTSTFDISEPYFAPWPVTMARHHDKAVRNIEILCLAYNGRGVADFSRPPDTGGMLESVIALEAARDVWLSTGFNVAPGMPETDGPPGVAALGHALTLCGKTVHYVCDSVNLALVRAALGELGPAAMERAVFTEMNENDETALPVVRRLFANVGCDACVALELPGRNLQGQRLNMRGLPINDFNAAVDEVMNQANALGIPTIGIGDGGNEAGTGGTGNVPLAMNGANMAAGIAAQSQVYAWNSNLGGLALAEILLARQGRSMSSVTSIQLENMVKVIMSMGAVDGCTRGSIPEGDTFVDGVNFETHAAFLGLLKRLAADIKPLSGTLRAEATV